MHTMPTTTDLTYRVVEGWEQLPPGMQHLDCVGVDTDSEDNLYVLTRAEPRVLAYRRDGSLLRSRGRGLVPGVTQGLTLGSHATVAVLGAGVGCGCRFGSGGALRLRGGTRGVGQRAPAAGTGYDGALESIPGGPHFNPPT